MNLFIVINNKFLKENIMQINPKVVLERRWLIPAEGSDPFDKSNKMGTKIAQNGVDCTLKEELVLEPMTFKNV